MGVLGRHFGLWSLNACRIVYVIEEEASLLKCYGFAFGTLPGHVERGEERFTVEWHRAYDSVFYEVFAFARPAHPLARVGPAVRAAGPETVRGCLPAGHGCGPSQHLPVPKRVPHPLQRTSAFHRHERHKRHERYFAPYL
jgi:hypothetical protein